jgi:Streptomyces sporulation and cell division protein, SsgA
MSSTDRGTVSAGQDLRLIGPDDLTVQLACGLHYSRQDPYAVRMSLDAGREEPVTWHVSRDLLTAALHGPEGIGDVRAWPTFAPGGPERSYGEKILNIELGPTDGCSRFEASASGMAAFLARTYELVPEGEETDYLNIDAGLAELLNW